MDEEIFLKATKSHKNLLKTYDESKMLYKQVIDYANKVLPKLSELLQKQKSRAQSLRQEMESLSVEMPDDLSGVRENLSQSMKMFNDTLNESMDKTIKVDMIVSDAYKRISDKNVQNVFKEKQQRENDEGKSFFGSLFG